jgi:hypothetical protein
MAGWCARLLFHGDRLIDAGVHDMLPGLRTTADAGAVRDGEPLTSVLVSGYALRGRVRGFYALGVGRLRLDPLAGVAVASEAAARHAEPATALSARQRATVRGWLEAFSPEAWSDSLYSFHRLLESPVDTGPAVLGATPTAESA